MFGLGFGELLIILVIICVPVLILALVISIITKALRRP